jgi:hypothetical protein
VSDTVVRVPCLVAVAVLFTARVVREPCLGVVAVLFTAIVVRVPCLGAVVVLYTLQKKETAHKHLSFEQFLLWH